MLHFLPLYRALLNVCKSCFYGPLVYMICLLQVSEWVRWQCWSYEQYRMFMHCSVSQVCICDCCVSQVCICGCCVSQVFICGCSVSQVCICDCSVSHVCICDCSVSQVCICDCSVSQVCICDWWRPVQKFQWRHAVYNTSTDWHTSGVASSRCLGTRCTWLFTGNFTSLKWLVFCWIGRKTLTSNRYRTLELRQWCLTWLLVQYVCILSSWQVKLNKYCLIWKFFPATAFMISDGKVVILR